jgi:hypothetical protein
MKLFYSNGAKYLYGTHDTDDVEESHLEGGESIVSSAWVYTCILTYFSFHTSKDRELGPFGNST